MTGGKIFDKVGVNKSTVSGTFPKKFRSKILGAEKKGTYWASGVSVVAHMKNPKIPSLALQYKIYCYFKRMVWRRDGRNT